MASSLPADALMVTYPRLSSSQAFPNRGWATKFARNAKRRLTTFPTVLFLTAPPSPFRDVLATLQMLTRACRVGLLVNTAVSGCVAMPWQTTVTPSLAHTSIRRCVHTQQNYTTSWKTPLRPAPLASTRSLVCPSITCTHRRTTSRWLHPNPSHAHAQRQTT